MLSLLMLGYPHLTPNIDPVYSIATATRSKTVSILWLHFIPVIHSSHFVLTYCFFVDVCFEHKDHQQLEKYSFCQILAHWCCISVFFFSSLLGDRMLASLFCFNLCCSHICNISSIVMSFLPPTSHHTNSEMKFRVWILLGAQCREKKGQIFKIYYCMQIYITVYFTFWLFKIKIKIMQINHNGILGEDQVSICTPEIK
jgi:hypothetical protein